MYCVGLGERSVSIEIRAFVEAYDKRLRVQHEVYLAIERALRENPGSTHLLRLLQQTHEQRLRLYRREQLVG